MSMRSLVIVLLLALTSGTLGSPFPGPEADPGYKVIKTVHFWDDDKDGEDLLKETLDLGDAKMDNNEIFELDESADRPEGRTLIGYGNGDGLHRSKHGQEAQHDNDRFQGEDNHIFSFKLNEDPDTKALVSDQLVNNSDVTVTKEGLKCVKKLMQVEYTDFTEVMTCVHKSEERCHTSYVTQFVGHQEQKCDEKFEKTCTIYYENVAVNEEVEVCKTYLCPDCTREGPEECDTVYDTVCETKRKIHNVLDDVVNCKTVEEKKCEQVTDGEHKVNFANISMHINVMCQDFGPRNSVTPGLLKDARWSRSVSTRPPRRRPAERSPGSCALPGGARRSRHGTLHSSKYYSTK